MHWPGNCCHNQWWSDIKCWRMHTSKFFSSGNGYYVIRNVLNCYWPLPSNTDCIHPQPPPASWRTGVSKWWWIEARQRESPCIHLWRINKLNVCSINLWKYMYMLLDEWSVLLHGMLMCAILKLYSSQNTESLRRPEYKQSSINSMICLQFESRPMGLSKNGTINRISLLQQVSSRVHPSLKTYNRHSFLMAMRINILY